MLSCTFSPGSTFVRGSCLPHFVSQYPSPGINCPRFEDAIVVVSIILVIFSLLVLDTHAHPESRFVRFLHPQRGVQLTGSGHEIGAVRAAEAGDRDIDHLAWSLPSKPSSQAPWLAWASTVRLLHLRQSAIRFYLTIAEVLNEGASVTSGQRDRRVGVSNEVCHHRNSCRMPCYLKRARVTRWWTSRRRTRTLVVRVLFSLQKIISGPGDETDRPSLMTRTRGILFRCSAWLETLTATYVVLAMSYLRYDMAKKAQPQVAKHVRVFIGVFKELALMRGIAGPEPVYSAAAFLSMSGNYTNQRSFTCSKYVCHQSWRLWRAVGCYILYTGSGLNWSRGCQELKYSLVQRFSLPCR